MNRGLLICVLKGINNFYSILWVVETAGGVLTFLILMGFRYQISAELFNPIKTKVLVSTGRNRTSRRLKKLKVKS